MVNTLIDWTVTLVVIVVVAVIVYGVLSNGAYYGDKLGDLIRGLIDFVSSTIRSATAG